MEIFECVEQCHPYIKDMEYILNDKNFNNIHFLPKIYDANQKPAYGYAENGSRKTKEQPISIIHIGRTIVKTVIYKNG